MVFHGFNLSKTQSKRDSFIASVYVPFFKLLNSSNFRSNLVSSLLMPPLCLPFHAIFKWFVQIRLITLKNLTWKHYFEKCFPFFGQHQPLYKQSFDSERDAFTLRWKKVLLHYCSFHFICGVVFSSCVSDHRSTWRKLVSLMAKTTGIDLKLLCSWSSFYPCCISTLASFQNALEIVAWTKFYRVSRYKVRVIGFVHKRPLDICWTVPSSQDEHVYKKLQAEISNKIPEM